MSEDLQNMATGAAAIWHLIVLGVIVTTGMLWADRHSDRVWRAELHARDTAAAAAAEGLERRLEERVDARYRSHAACRRGQDTPGVLPASLWEQANPPLPFNVTDLGARRSRP
jgi:hypothetical protein